jgi:hypothetical protein
VLEAPGETCHVAQSDRSRSRAHDQHRRPYRDIAHNGGLVTTYNGWTIGQKAFGRLRGPADAERGLLHRASAQFGRAQSGRS